MRPWRWPCGVQRALGRAVPADHRVRAFEFDDLADRPLVSYPARRSWPPRNRWAELAFQARDDLPVTNRHASPIGGPPEGDGDRQHPWPTTSASCAG